MIDKIRSNLDKQIKQNPYRSFLMLKKDIFNQATRFLKKEKGAYFSYKSYIVAPEHD